MPRPVRGNANGYDGWTNWETWNLNLHCTQDSQIYQARMKLRPREWTDVQDFVVQHFRRGTVDMEPGDMRKIDWDELAESWSAEYDESKQSNIGPWALDWRMHKCLK